MNNSRKDQIEGSRKIAIFRLMKKIEKTYKVLLRNRRDMLHKVALIDVTKTDGIFPTIADAVDVLEQKGMPGEWEMESVRLMFEQVVDVP